MTEQETFYEFIIFSVRSIFPECEVKNKVLIGFFLGGVSLLAILISLCGIGLSMGIRKLSIFSFFSAIGLLVLLRLAGRLLGHKIVRKPEF